MNARAPCYLRQDTCTLPPVASARCARAALDRPWCSAQARHPLSLWTAISVGPALDHTHSAFGSSSFTHRTSLKQTAVCEVSD